MKKRNLILLVMAMVMGLSSLTGCAAGAKETAASETTEAVASAEETSTEIVMETETSAPASGGTLLISVNPKIAVEYDKDGLVTGVTARNNEAFDIINKCEGLIGAPTDDAVAKLVTAIGDAGYFVEDVDGSGRQIIIEIEEGSAIPYDSFVDDVVNGVKACVNTHHWQAPLDIHNESDYGMTDDVDTDYGPNNDGVTDYNDTDYGPNNDGVTDYNDTDYGPNNDGVTDYNDTDYGPNSDGVTDYNDTNYGDTNYDDGGSDYSDSDDDGDSGYDD